MKKLLMVALVVAVGIGGWRWKGDTVVSRNILVNRIWLDHLPRGERDTVQVFVLINDESLGVFAANSQWRGGFEGFRYELHGGELRVVYPQTGERETVQAKATRCNEGAMDFCLEVSGATRGVKRYYSQEGWEIDGGLEAAKTRVAALIAGH